MQENLDAHYRLGKEKKTRTFLEGLLYFSLK